jgi:hypothetical protein
MHVVIRIPWKRPASFLPLTQQTSPQPASNPNFVWTPDKDIQLWKLLSLYQPNEIDWDFIQEQMGISAEECFERSSYLYKQQLESIQRHMFQKKRDILLKSHLSNSSQVVASSTHSKRSSNKKKRRDSKGEENISNSSHKKASSSSLSRTEDRISKEQLYQLITKYDFDWMKIGAELGVSPHICRRTYLKYEKASQPQSSPAAPKIQTATTENFQLPKSPEISRPQTPCLQELENIPAFILSENAGKETATPSLSDTRKADTTSLSTLAAPLHIIEDYASSVQNSTLSHSQSYKNGSQLKENKENFSTTSNEETFSSSTGSLTQSALASAMLTMESDSPGTTSE